MSLRVPTTSAVGAWVRELVGARGWETEGRGMDLRARGSEVGVRGVGRVAGRGCRARTWDPHPGSHY